MKVFGIELDEWESADNETFVRKNLGIYSIIKIILAIRPNNGWSLHFYDELKPIRTFCQNGTYFEFSEKMIPEEAIKQSDEFILRAEKLIVFQ